MIDQVVWLVANIVGESVVNRNKVLGQTSIIDSLNALVNKLVVMHSMARIGFLNNIIWCIYNLVRR
jgi:hypothetical protein